MGVSDSRNNRPAGLGGASSASAVVLGGRTSAEEFKKYAKEFQELADTLVSAKVNTIFCAFYAARRTCQCFEQTTLSMNTHL